MKTWLTLALDAPGCSSLLDFYISGPSQQAAVEAFACAIRPQQEQLLNHQARFAMPGVLIFSQPTDKTYEKQNSDPHLPTYWP